VRATSFRVRDGKVRNLAGHLERLGLSEAESQRLRTELRQRVHDAAASGAHAINPIIWADTGSWTIDVRPDRTIKSHIIMDAHPHNDERRQPQVKGPDLMWLSTRMNITKGRGAADGDVAVFQRFAQHFQHLAVEFGQFVEKQYTVVR